MSNKKTIDINYIIDFNRLSDTNTTLDNSVIDDVFWYIDYILIRSTSIFNKIVDIENSQNRMLNVRKMDENKSVEISSKQLITYISETKKAIETIFFNKNLNILDQQIFKELKTMVIYYRKISRQEVYDIYSENDFTIYDREYHEQIATFNYLYSIFDKTTNIFKHLYKNYHSDNSKFISEIEEPFGRKLIAYSEILIRGQNYKLYFDNWFNQFSNSPISNLLRFKRNALVHEFTDVNSRVNLSIFTSTLYIVMLRMLAVVGKCIVGNKELKDLFIDKI